MENIERKSICTEQRTKTKFHIQSGSLFLWLLFLFIIFFLKEEEKRNLYVFFSLNARNRIEINHT